MDEIIDRRFERVEKALATLITSISTYNPSPVFANDLVAADAELNQGLEQCKQPPHLLFILAKPSHAVSVHQSNYSKIISLRATSSALDTQIRETLTLLTSARRELIATPSTTFPTSTNPVSYSELLTYARRISKFTLPPHTREPRPQPANADAEIGNGTPKESKSETQTNGTSTPVAVPNGVERDIQQTQTQPGSAMEIDSATPAATETAQNTQNTTATMVINSLPEDWVLFMNPDNGLFVPWPSEENIRKGALATIEILRNQGVDPAVFDPEKVAELEAEQKRVAEEAERAMEEEQASYRRVEEERRRSVVGSGERGGEPQKVFQLETFDDDEDED